MDLVYNLEILPCVNLAQGSKGDELLNITQINNARLKFFKMSLSKDNVFIGRALINSEAGIFPLLCFNSFASKLSSAEENDVINVEGTLKDYSYNDYNGVSHFVKLMLVTSMTINGIRQSITAEEKEKNESYWKKIKPAYQVIDVIEFERLSKMEGAVETCCP